jgi:RecA/RadA recombinase
VRHVKKKGSDAIEITTVPRRLYLSTGFPALDELLGGGIPRDRITVIVGNPNTGKSTLAYAIARRFQEENWTPMIIDIGRGLTEARLFRAGIQPEKLIVAHVPSYEDLTEDLTEKIEFIASRLLNNSLGLGAVIVDPLDALRVRNPYLTEQRRHDLLDRAVAELLPVLASRRIAFVTVCRNLVNFGIQFGNQHRPVGWIEPLLHAAAIILDLSEERHAEEGGVVVGRFLGVKVRKNQEGRPPGECSIYHSYQPPAIH